MLILLLHSVSGITIKLASSLPEGSEWHRALLEMADEWRRITNGSVKIRIFPGGIAGDGEEVVRRMRIGQMDMAVLTSATLATIAPDTFVMSMPFYLESEGELDHMLSVMTPTFDQAFTDKGFKMLGWSKSGWIYFYSTKEVRTPDDLKKLKLAVSPDDQDAIDAYKEMGFNVIPLNMNDVLMGLQGGMIEAFYTSPLAAASYQWFGLAPYMLNVKVAPLIGATIISEKTWRRIPSRYHEELQESVSRAARDFYQHTRDMETRAINIMSENGLQMVEVAESQEDLWHTVFGSDFSAFVGDGKVINDEIFSRYRSVIEGYRNRR